MTPSDIRMHEVLIILTLTLIHGLTDLNHKIINIISETCLIFLLFVFNVLNDFEKKIINYTVSVCVCLS